MLTEVRLAGPAATATAELETEFPTVRFVASDEPAELVIEAADWLAAPSFAPFDARMRPDTILSVIGPGAPSVAMEVLTRYQRHVERTNPESDTPSFRALRERHRALHDLSKPLVVADLDHAVDTWQWMLRLDPGASVEVQLAALLHDIERLESEADVRVEQHAADYQAFKDAHAALGGARAYDLVLASGFPPSVAARAGELVARHERRDPTPDLALLNDADALSFFSLNSSGYRDYFGAAQTRKKIAWTLARMSERALTKLLFARLRPDVGALLDELG